MIDVNLILQRRQQRARTAKLLRTSVYAIFGLAVLVCLLYAGMTISIWRLKAEIGQCDARLSSPRLVQSLQQVDFLEKETARLHPQVDLLNRVQSSQQCWTTVLKDFSAAVPSKVWMTGLNSRLENEKQVLTVAGSAFNQSDVGSFMLNLQQARWCEPPALNYTRTTKQCNRDVVNFEVALAIPKPVGSDLK